MWLVRVLSQRARLPASQHDISELVVFLGMIGKTQEFVKKLLHSHYSPKTAYFPYRFLPSLTGKQGTHRVRLKFAIRSIELRVFCADGFCRQGCFFYHPWHLLEFIQNSGIAWQAI